MRDRQSGLARVAELGSNAGECRYQRFLDKPLRACTPVVQKEQKQPDNAGQYCPAIQGLSVDPSRPMVGRPETARSEGQYRMVPFLVLQYILSISTLLNRWAQLIGFPKESDQDISLLSDWQPSSVDLIGGIDTVRR